MKMHLLKTRAASLAAIVIALTPATRSFADGPAAVPEPPKSPWESSAAAGLTLTRGNSDTLLFTATILSVMKKDPNEVKLGADTAYGEADGVENNNSVHGFAQYNRLLSERVYLYGRVDGLHDEIADIEYRFTLGIGPGYYFIKETNTTLTGEVGPGLVIEKKGGESDVYPTIRLAENFEHKFSDRAKIWQSVEFIPNLLDMNNYIMNAELGLESGLTKKFSLRVVLQDSYNSAPAEGRKANDLKLIAGLAYKF